MGKGIILDNRYQVLSKIGSGGMADVYKGKDLMLNRFVAIKVLKKEFRVEEDFVDKFKSEAQAAAGLSNPNIVNVYDVGEDRGLNYMVMELVEGITLKEYIHKKGRLSFKETVSIAIQICQGIGAAHAADLIHRDIKPQNIIISTDGKVKVTDFGIAKALSSNTVTGTAMGSVHYTSPEQARGGYSDVRSDIYSIGITIYEMITGEVPFDGDSTVSVAMQHLQKEMPYPSDIVPDIPYSLEQIIMKCTLKNASRRYASTQDLIRDLKHSLVDPEGDFVYISPVSDTESIIITDSELDKMKNYYKGPGEDDDDDADGYEDDFEDEDEDDDDHKKDKINPTMSKATKILTVVVAVIILFILIFVIGKAVGIFKFGPGTTTESSTKEVVVPDLLGKTEEEAKEALDKLELGYKVVESKESDKYDKGQIMEQTPGKGEKVKENSTVKLVISLGKKAEEIQIPNVVGMSEADAEKALQSAGFTNFTSEYEENDSVEQGNVISVDPGADSMAAKDKKITLKVSTGAGRKAVPSVVGMSESEATSAIQGAGFALGSVTKKNDSAPSGTVISQDPASGNRKQGTKVNIVVSSGPEQVSVPSLAGRSLTDAKTALTNVGLSSTESYAKSDTVAQGCVISTDPGSGASVDVGTTITLVISDGPANPEGTGTDTGTGTEGTDGNTMND